MIVVKSVSIFNITLKFDSAAYINKVAHKGTLFSKNHLIFSNIQTI